jgi:hypothetical protein
MGLVQLRIYNGVMLTFTGFVLVCGVAGNLDFYVHLVTWLVYLLADGSAG